MSKATYTKLAGRKVLSAATFSLLTCSVAASGLPAVQTDQVPGFYRQAIGDHSVTALYDGYVHLDPALLKGLSPNDVQALLARSFRENDSGMQTAVNGYLVHTGTNLVLIDVGAGECFGPTTGNIAANIRAAGYQPSDIDTVLLTHLHADHVCGLTDAAGEAAFPNATVWAAKHDADFWLSKEIANAAPEEAKGFFDMAQAALAPYQLVDRFRTFETGTVMQPSDDIVPGVSALATHGHTPGHVSYLLQSGDTHLLVWGDIVHAHAVQLPHPEVSIEFDVDSAQAIQTRASVLEELASNRWMVAGAHLPFPGIGNVRKETSGYSWVPIDYAP